MDIVFLPQQSVLTAINDNWYGFILTLPITKKFQSEANQINFQGVRWYLKAYQLKTNALLNYKMSTLGI